MSDVEHIYLFPTVVTRMEREVEDKEKDEWFSMFLKHSNQEGKSHDWLGFEELHHEESLQWFYRDVLMPAVVKYLEHLQVQIKDFDIYITKSFFNVTDKAGITRHNHVENHISFVYYPHIAEGKERDLMLWTNNRKHPNEPYDKFFANTVKNGDWNQINSLMLYMPVKEGTLYIFPSDLDHDIEVREGDEPSGIQGFKKKEDLLKTRFCVAGDMMIIRNHSESYQRMLPPLDKWKRVYND